MNCGRESERAGRRSYAAAIALFVLAAACGCGQPKRDDGERPVVGRSQRTARDRAVQRGLAWLARFLKDEDNLNDVRVDGVSIFVEAMTTSRAAAIRRQAAKAARRLAGRLAERYLELDDPLTGVEVIDVLTLASEAKALGLNAEALLAKAQRAMEACEAPEDIFGLGPLSPKVLKAASEDEIFDLLLDVYAVEKARAVYPGRFAMRFGLADVLGYLRGRRFVSLDEDTTSDKRTFEDHAFLATHVAYVLSDYGRLKLHRADAPWLYRYLRANFDAVLADEDVELVAEFIDVFRSLGLSEADDAHVRLGTALLLRTQKADGSWGKPAGEDDPYDAMHPTWCAVMGLRERTFEEGTPYHRRLRRILRRLRAPPRTAAGQVHARCDASRRERTLPGDPRRVESHSRPPGHRHRAEAAAPPWAKASRLPGPAVARSASSAAWDIRGADLWLSLFSAPAVGSTVCRTSTPAEACGARSAAP